MIPSFHEFAYFYRMKAFYVVKRKIYDKIKLELKENFKSTFYSMVFGGVKYEDRDTERD